MKRNGHLAFALAVVTVVLTISAFVSCGNKSDETGNTASVTESHVEDTENSTEAHNNVSGKESENSVSVPDEFVETEANTLVEIPIEE